MRAHSGAPLRGVVMGNGGVGGNRRSVRLRGYDYSRNGVYFVTICTRNRVCLFGDVNRGMMRLNAMGEVVLEEWIRSRELRPNMRFDDWVVMPNHFHGVVSICDSTSDRSQEKSFARRSNGVAPRRPRSLSSFVAMFKSTTTRRINVIRDMPGRPVWQRNYYESIVRDRQYLLNIQRYIKNNPAAWSRDQLHPKVKSKW